MLRSYSRLLAGLPCFQYPLCLVDLAVFVVFGNHPCLPPVTLAVPEDPRRDPFAADKSSALRVALVIKSTHGSSSSSGLSSEISSEKGLLSASWLLSL